MKMTREARQSRPQLICVLADDSRSMAGQKAQAATLGIQEMLMECQAKGPPGPRSYFSFTLIRFDEEILLEHDEVPVRDIDPDSIHFEGGGGMTNITEALETLSTPLTDYMERLQQHEESSDHPLPLVILFSDGYQNIGDPSSAIEAAGKIKALNLDGEHVMVVTAGVSIGGDRPDEETLRAIAGRPNWYQHINNVTALSEFIAKVGSSGAASPAQLDADMEIFFGTGSPPLETAETDSPADPTSADHSHEPGESIDLGDLETTGDVPSENGNTQQPEENIDLADLEVSIDTGSHRDMDGAIDLTGLEVGAGGDPESEGAIDLTDLEVGGGGDQASDGAVDLTDLEVDAAISSDTDQDPIPDAEIDLTGLEVVPENDDSAELDNELDLGDLELT
ncbi:MAG: VWA domain-containing protein [Pirellulaceae bacterium]|nr:VWA domain-containing protein [Pirellulaceae bacterium]